jgi:hypothetical protein
LTHTYQELRAQSDKLLFSRPATRNSNHSRCNNLTKVIAPRASATELHKYYFIFIVAVSKYATHIFLLIVAGLSFTFIIPLHPVEGQSNPLPRTINNQTITNQTGTTNQYGISNTSNDSKAMITYSLSDTNSALLSKDFTSSRFSLIAIIRDMINNTIGENVSKDALIHITGFDKRTNNVTGLDNASALMNVQFDNLDTAIRSNNSTKLAVVISLDLSQCRTSGAPNKECIYVLKLENPMRLP